MIEARKFWESLLYRLGGIVVTTVFGLLVGLYALEITSTALAATIVAIYLCIVGAYIIIDQVRRYRHLGVVEKQKRLELAREGILLAVSSEKVAHNQKKINYYYQRMNKKLEGKTIVWDSEWIGNQKELILRAICETLKQDTRGFKGAGDYFKATLFRMKTKNHLELDCCWYPSGRHPKTEKMPRKIKGKKGQVTAFRALDTESIQIIPNIPREIGKGANAEWVELWEGQAKEYASMLCIPISVGERTRKSYEVVSILTIDTNRLDYFLKEDESFWANFLAPFRAQLTFLYLAEQ